MRIKELKINGFGKIENKEIKLKDGFNIIYGKNETGKSTLLKFISAIFYGLSKNKNGQCMPDIEKFRPWHNENFSGKLKYELDNNENFEVYREFKSKNPKIFNENLEDVSKEFTVDKGKGIQFFYDQTGLEEEIFNSSVITKQAEVKLDEKSQNNIIQKISNILGTGEDTNSYEKVVSKLKKRIIDEIGTTNTKEKPINIIDKRIEEIKKEKSELEKYQNIKFEKEEELKNKKLELINKKEQLETLRVANIQLEKIKSRESKIEIAQRLVEDSQKEIDKLEESKEEIIPDIKIKNLYKIVSAILLMISIVSIVFIRNIIFRIVPSIITIAFIICILILNIKDREELKEKKKEYKIQLKTLKNNKKIQEEECNKLKKEYDTELLELSNKYKIYNITTIVEDINKLQSNINELTLNLHTLEIDNNAIQPKLEKYVNLEEELENIEEEKIELEKKREEIRKAIDFLEISYNKMKQEITPKFTDRLSRTIEKISDMKYKKVRINTLGEIIVETKDGEYINAENLSIGTIDQLYLSLRLATIEEVTKESMPIILDESFAYYDGERLKNMLKYLSEEYKNKQIIIFTCTKREQEILKNLDIRYNLIEL